MDFKIATAVDRSECPEQIEWPILLRMCAPISYHGQDTHFIGYFARKMETIFTYSIHDKNHSKVKNIYVRENINFNVYCLWLPVTRAWMDTQKRSSRDGPSLMVRRQLTK